MMLPPLTIIPAGAGSGKTTALQHRLGDWVASGMVAPERIVAVTFTEAAASELRQRIRARLLEINNLEAALRLDQGYISTIHGFGLRLLTEFAFDAGHSPKPRLLNEDEERNLACLAVARTDKADPITGNLLGFGYGHIWGKTAAEAFRDDCLDAAARLRTVGARQEANYTAHIAHINERITQLYGKTGDGAAFTQVLHSSVERLLQSFPENLAYECGTNYFARKELQNNFRSLKSTLSGNELKSNWKLWQDLRKLRKSKRGTPLPAEYDELADAVIAAADQLPNHSGPLEHALAHIRTLLEVGQDVLTIYSRTKRESGLVDYSDMIAMADDLLRNNSLVLKTLVNRIDCLVVDEFQDTNPSQFSLLWQLTQAGVPTVVVGDLKQAIMGFQNADPRLFGAICQQNPSVMQPLTNNWRSQPRLMEFVNCVGPCLFGNDYVPLTPKAADSELAPLEAISFADKADRNQHCVRANYVAHRLKGLIRDRSQSIVDRRTGQHRPLRGGDIAVLCPTHGMLAKYADVLRSTGLRVRLKESGWFESKVVQIAWQALAYLANPEDRHAALYLAVTELGSLTLEQALKQLINDGRIEEPLLQQIDSLAPGVEDRTVYALVADTLSALRIFDVVSEWADGEQARANLLRLLFEAGEFMDANREALARGGFHGSGLQSFLAWVKAKAANKNHQADPKVLDEDAVELVTWHSAKGKEWPVVVVCGLEYNTETRLPKLDLSYAGFENLSRLLDDAKIEYSPSFAAPESKERFLSVLNAGTEMETRRLLYVAMTRAREKLILEWPKYASRQRHASYYSILSKSVGMSLKDQSWRVKRQIFPCIITEGGTDEPGWEAEGGASSGADNEAHDTSVTLSLPTTGRRAIRREEPPTELTPESVTPSRLAVQPALENGPDKITVEQYGSGFTIETVLNGAPLGSLLHRGFEVLSANPAQAHRLAEITGVPLEKPVLEAIETSVSQFTQWIEHHFEPISIASELPVLALSENNSVISGTVDLVIETQQGLWIIDHKSDPIDDPKTSYSHYRAQLHTYAEALTKEGSVVLGVGVNWIRLGSVVLEIQ